MNWIDVNEKLPPSPTRVLARCIKLQIDEWASTTCWNGVIDVLFDAQRGWIICETEVPVNRDFRITHYTEHPFPTYPYELKKNNLEN